MQPSAFDMNEFWRGREISTCYRELIDRRGLAKSIVNLWRHPEDWFSDDAYYERLDTDDVDLHESPQ